MNSQTYAINRRINTPLQFQGLKAQYIYYAGAIIISAMFGFAILYIVGVNSYIALLIAIAWAVLGITNTYRRSHRYGQFGWKKKQFARRLPKTLLVNSRRLFTQLKK